MEPYSILQEDADSGIVLPHGSPLQGVFLRVYKPKTYKLPQNLFKVLGSIQIVIGFISISLGITAAMLNTQVYYYRYGFSYIGYGIWCGVIFCLSGSFTIVAGVRKTLCWLITCMVMSIIAAVFTLVTIVLGGVEIDTWLDVLKYNTDDWYTYNEWEQAVVGLTTSVFMIIGGITEAVLAIICSAITCNKTCCKPTTYQQFNRNQKVQSSPGDNLVVISSPNHAPLYV